jgi:ABC-type multidrug transport system fused ATPase/permease subunit
VEGGIIILESMDNGEAVREFDDNKAKKGRKKSRTRGDKNEKGGRNRRNIIKKQKITIIINNFEEKITSHLGTFLLVFIGLIILSFILRKFTLDLQNLPDMSPIAIDEISKIRKMFFFILCVIGLLMLMVVFLSLKSYFDRDIKLESKDPIQLESMDEKYSKDQYNSERSQWMFFILAILIFYLTLETYYEFDSDLNLNLGLLINNSSIVAFLNSLGFTILQLPILISFVFYTSVQMYTFEYKEKEKIKRIQAKIKDYISNHRIVKTKRYENSDSVLLSEIEMLINLSNKSYETILWMYKKVSQVFYFLISCVTTFFLKLFDLRIWILIIFIVSLLIVKLFTYRVLNKWRELKERNIFNKEN